MDRLGSIMKIAASRSGRLMMKIMIKIMMIIIIRVS